ncbi:ABC transporter, partial [Rhodobacteraceae bacterium WD3A24]
VRLGRTPHRAAAGRAADARAVAAALERMELAALRDRPATELSGGEQARVLIARALAQEAPLLLADEPIAGLDPAHQLAAMENFAALATEGCGAVVALHDLGLAARFCTRLLVMERGHLVADGPPGDVLTPELLGRVFGVRAYFEITREGPVFQPLARIPRTAGI